MKSLWFHGDCLGGSLWGTFAWAQPGNRHQVLSFGAPTVLDSLKLKLKLKLAAAKRRKYCAVYKVLHCHFEVMDLTEERKGEWQAGKQTLLCLHGTSNRKGGDSEKMVIKLTRLIWIQSVSHRDVECNSNYFLSQKDPDLRKKIT